MNDLLTLDDACSLAVVLGRTTDVEFPASLRTLLGDDLDDQAWAQLLQARASLFTPMAVVRLIHLGMTTYAAVIAERKEATPAEQLAEAAIRVFAELGQAPPPPPQRLIQTNFHRDRKDELTHTTQEFQAEEE